MSSSEKGVSRGEHPSYTDDDKEVNVEDVRGPDLLQRAKEEVEAIIETFHHEKEHEDASPSVWSSIARFFQNLCSR
jgi:hypothetical protein